MLLSIVMMIKNEEKVLESSLSALVPLMKLVESELIILDTGSTDKSIQIARKYTDKVYYKEWNKNFAEMRNESIKYASGKWILILDADEELIEYNRLVEFFNKNIYKQYNSASIELKNIFSEDEKRFSIGMLPRVFRKTMDFRYEGAIHEQPIYKEPIFKRIASFKHYGYLFVDEELRQKKSIRNKEILFEALKEDEYNPYLNYQLGKDFDVSGEYTEALYYLEKSKKIYSKYNRTPTFVFQNIARLYLNMRQDKKCINLCLEYIKSDNKNIDMYFYLASSQMRLGEYDKSIENYKRYIFLIDNYDITTQANDISCTGNTISNIQEAKENIIRCYFNLEQYGDVINYVSKIGKESISNLYYVIFMSLYKENRLHDIKQLYIKCTTTNVEKIKIIENIENLLGNVKRGEKESIYKILSQIEDDYGKLNTIRLGGEITNSDIENILSNNNEYCYGDVLYYYINNFEAIEKVLKTFSSIKIEKFISHIVANRKDCILKLYEYLIKTPLKVDLNDLKILSIISKCLLYKSGLIGDKYTNIFNLYITHNYDYLRGLYSSEISDEELIYLVKDIESEFILKYVNIQQIKYEDSLTYVKEMKKLLLNNQCYKKGIKLTIDKFEKEFNENRELKDLKKKYKVMIEEKINSGNLDVAEKLIKDYEEIFKYDDINNMKGIINIYRNNIEESEKYFKLAYCNDRYNEDLLFNIAYIKEQKGELKEARSFYNKIIQITSDEELKQIASKKLHI